MISRCLLLGAIFGAALTCAGSARAQYKEGDTVVVGEDANLRVPEGATLKLRPGTPHVVRSVNGKWLWVTTAHTGWIDSAQVVPLSRAREYFTQQIRRKPHSASLLAARGSVLVELGQFDDALDDLNTALRMAPGDAGIHNDRGWVWTKKGQFDKALIDFHQALTLDPNSLPAYLNRSRVWLLTGNFDKALADCNEALRLNPKQPNAYTYRGIAWGGKGDSQRALADYSEALRLDPKYASGFYARGKFWMAQNDHAKALADFNESLRLDPQGYAYKERGELRFAMLQNDEAIADFSEALRLDPSDTDVLLLRSIAYMFKSDFQNVLADLNLALKIRPEEPRLNSSLALMLATLPEARFRNGQEAVRLATKACVLTQWKDAGKIDVLAAACAEAGDFAKAVQYSKQYLQMCPQPDQALARKHLDLYESGQPLRLFSGTQ